LTLSIIPTTSDLDKLSVISATFSNIFLISLLLSLRLPVTDSTLAKILEILYFSDLIKVSILNETRSKLLIAFRIPSKD
jgi:hypothetical protein